jgi:hypothetical protein
VAKEEHWEFYCTPDEVCAELGNWHWRLRRGGTVNERSLRFDSFNRRYLDAVQHSFAGRLYFTADTRSTRRVVYRN